MIIESSAIDVGKVLVYNVIFNFETLEYESYFFEDFAEVFQTVTSLFTEFSTRQQSQRLLKAISRISITTLTRA